MASCSGVYTGSLGSPVPDTSQRRCSTSNWPVVVSQVTTSQVISYFSNAFESGTPNRYFIFCSSARLEGSHHKPPSTWSPSMREYAIVLNTSYQDGPGAYQSSGYGGIRFR